MSDQHNQSEKDQLNHGSALEHGQAHQEHHNQWSRRGFMKTFGAATSASFLMGGLPVTATSYSPLAHALTNADNDRILVLIRLQGGNDSLNMIVPVFDYGTYAGYRPNIAIPENQVISLNDEVGMAPTMTALNNMWQDGQMKVAHTVGYPDQNLSHFRSTDIWSSASDANVVEESGWLGRYLNTCFPDFVTNPPDYPPAVMIGSAGNITYTNQDRVNMGFAVGDINTLQQLAETGQLYDPNIPDDCHYGSQLSFIRTIANTVVRYGEVISDAYDEGTNASNYAGQLGPQLALVARLIKGGLPTRLYLVTLNGFDTHANQNGQHPQLMQDLSEAVAAFYGDLAVGGHAERVLAMTFSEFSRRVQQNASNGTDHGGAQELLLFGPGLNGNGFVGDLPDMQNLNAANNVEHSIDFRQLYASVLENWLCIDSGLVDTILGQSFERLELGLDCAPVSVFDPQRPKEEIPIQIAYQSNQVHISYELPRSERVQLHVVNMLGQVVETLVNDRQPAGPHRATFHTQGRPAGMYVYSLQVGRQVYSRKLVAAQ